METRPVQPDAALIEELHNLVGRVPDIRAAVLFGSHAMGRAHAESDVDLLVVVDPRAGHDFEVSHQPFDGTTLELTFVSTTAFERELRRGRPFPMAVLRHGVDVRGHEYLQQLRELAPVEPAPEYVRTQAASARRRLADGDLRGAATYALNAKRLAGNDLHVSCHLERLAPPRVLTDALVEGWIEEAETRCG